MEITIDKNQISKVQTKNLKSDNSRGSNTNPPVPPKVIVRLVEAFRNILEVVRRKTLPAPLSICEILLGHWQSQAIICAAQLGIADVLQNRNMRVEDLAKQIEVDSDMLYRVMRMLATMGIFREISNKEFSMTPLARPLLSGTPDSVRDICILHGREFHWNAWGSLSSAVKNGVSALEANGHGSLFEYLNLNREDSDIFDRAMTALTSQSAYIIAKSYNFAQFKNIVDIGGGQGDFLRKILLQNKKLNGIVFDQVHVADNVNHRLDFSHVEGRLRVERGDFFHSKLPQADAYILKNIIHDWNDELALRILENCRRSMLPNSKLLIVEAVVPQNNSPHWGKYLDMEMLVVTKGGKERTSVEMKTLLGKAGFRVLKIHSTAAIESIVEAVPLEN